MTSTPDRSSGEQELYHDYSVDDEDQPSNLEDLGDPDVDDELDRGYSQPERYSAGQGYGNTPYEEATGETLDQRIAQEEPERDPYIEAEALGGSEGLSGEVGDQRAGRLVDPDEGVREDTEKDLVADDVGIDGAAASAEEAAMHVVSEEDVAGDLDYDIDDTATTSGTDPER